MKGVIITPFKPEDPTYGKFDVESMHVHGEWMLTGGNISIEKVWCKGQPVSCGEDCPTIIGVRAAIRAFLDNDRAVTPADPQVTLSAALVLLDRAANELGQLSHTEDDNNVHADIRTFIAEQNTGGKS